jgi:LysM repeat protein
MNNPSPLVPQCSFAEQKNKNRARVKIAVFFILAVHGIGLLALLMQGCKQDKSSASDTEQTNATAPPTFVADMSNTQPSTATAPTAGAPTNPPAVAESSMLPNPPQVNAGQDYVIAKGDAFSSLAKKFSVSVKAIQEANPGVLPTKLQIGQKLHIPPAPPSAPTATASTGQQPAGDPAALDTTSGQQMYAVKSGDTLSAIAKHFGTRIAAIRSANSLKTDNIKVGQKLKIPAKTTTPASATPTGTELTAAKAKTV